MHQTSKKQLFYLIGSILLLLLTAFLFNRFLAWHEYRSGIYFNDPVFHYFRAIDYSVLTFLVLYTSLFFFVFQNRKNLDRLSKLAISYTIVLWMRLLCLFLIPFYADYDALKLEDPFLNTFIYPGNYVERDLFFSGHVAILVLLVLLSESYSQRVLFTLSSLIVGVTVVLQKVHFSIDVIAAPFFALLAVRMVDFFEKKYFTDEKRMSQNRDR